MAASAPSKTDQEDLNKHVRSMLLNGAIGDTYGAPIEMMPHEVIMKRYGVVDKYIVTHKSEAAMYCHTDDTQMTIAVVNFLVDLEHDEYTKDAMIAFQAKFFEPSRRYGRGTYYVLLHFIQHQKVKLFNKEGSFADGGLMRVSPLAFIALRDELSDDRLKELIEIVHYPTHVQPETQYTSFVFIKLLVFLFSIRNANDKKRLILEYLNKVQSEDKQRINASIAYILENISESEYVLMESENVIGLDGIKCWECLATALVALIKNLDSPKLIVAKAITYGGDCDTIASVAGQMAGILFGETALRRDWLAKLEKREYLEELITKLIHK